MALNFGRWRSKQSGEPLAEIRITHYVSRVDLIEAAVHAVFDDTVHLDNVTWEDVEPRVQALTASQIETALRDGLTDRGVTFTEFGASELVGQVFYDLVVEPVTQTVDRLFPVNP